MGFLTPVLIRNDALSDLEDKSFLARLIAACVNRKSQSISAYSFSNAVECLGTRHADEPRLLVVKGNTMIEISSYDEAHLSSEFYKECAKFAKTEANSFLKRSKNK